MADEAQMNDFSEICRFGFASPRERQGFFGVLRPECRANPD
jgi:hypothetical protein